MQHKEEIIIKPRLKSLVFYGRKLDIIIPTPCGIKNENKNKIKMDQFLYKEILSMLTKVDRNKKENNYVDYPA